MRAGELRRVVEAHGCRLKPHGRGVWRIERSPGNYSVITTPQLKCTNEAKLVSVYVPAAKVSQ